MVSVYTAVYTTNDVLNCLIGSTHIKRRGNECCLCVPYSKTRHADRSSPETIVSHVLRRCHPRFRPYLFGRPFSSLVELAGFARQIAEALS